MKNILFVCTGNTCRSSMAEALFKDMLDNLDEDMEDIKVHSAGVFAVANHGASPQAITVMKSRGIDLSQHRSKPLTKEKIEEADLILTMTSKHKKLVLDVAPDAESKVHTLKEYAEYGDEVPTDIGDPFGQPVESYEETANEIQEALSKVLKLMKEK